MIDKFEPIDVIAMVIILGGMLLTANGYNGTISNILIMVSAYYFGKRSSGVIHVENRD